MGRPRFAGAVEVGFWEAVRSGLSVSVACERMGVSLRLGQRWFDEAGGVISNGVTAPSGRYLSDDEREEIGLAWAEGKTVRAIAVQVGRHAATISRELRRNGSGPRPDRPDSRIRYKPSVARDKTRQRARRPKPVKLADNARLRGVVQAGLCQRWSPQQISARLVRDYPDDAEMRVSHETIYQSLYVQGRGALRRELATYLRTGRTVRKPRRQARARRSRLPNMVNISQRPPEVEDRAVPGHWEGDLIIGMNNGSAIGTLVERTTRFCLLLHLPDSYDAPTVRDAVILAIQSLPEQLARSLTWDQGREMARHEQISMAAGIDIYFCDPHSPWQRGSNENTNGLLRQYFRKGTDLSVHSAQHLADVAAQLNGRPRDALGFNSPAEELQKLLFQPDQQTRVATTG